MLDRRLHDLFCVVLVYGLGWVSHSADGVAEAAPLDRQRERFAFTMLRLTLLAPRPLGKAWRTSQRENAKIRLFGALGIGEIVIRNFRQAGQAKAPPGFSPQAPP